MEGWASGKIWNMETDKSPIWVKDPRGEDPEPWRVWEVSAK